MLGPNQLLFDLGIDNVYNEEAVNRKIMEMDEVFHLVMILEHFEVRKIAILRQYLTAFF